MKRKKKKNSQNSQAETSQDKQADPESKLAKEAINWNELERERKVRGFAGLQEE